ncbi:MAG: hypothetical protein CM1200mP38_5270 [Dehalococcoidia bacterium]|nr:MAG: hypothetical protein CM1200mP38_5270 [Dehalococcoidia bacterium]
MTFDEAAFGISNLETAVGSLFSLIDSNLINIDKIIESLSYAPAKFLKERKIGNLSKGSNADVTIIAPKEKWIVDSSQFKFKRNKLSNRWNRINWKNSCNYIQRTNSIATRINRNPETN